MGWLAAVKPELAAGVHAVPPGIEEEIARLTLASLGAAIDELTQAQREYLNSWRAGR